jgi:hypothetical protein
MDSGLPVLSAITQKVFDCMRSCASWAQESTWARVLRTLFFGSAVSVARSLFSRPRLWLISRFKSHDQIRTASFPFTAIANCSSSRNTMFKGILPPRRVPSSEFIIVNPLPDNGKENLPSPPLHPPASSPNAKAKSAKAASQDKSKRKKGDLSHPISALTSSTTDREFDRLLVRGATSELPL